MTQFILAKSMSPVTYLIVSFQVLTNNFLHSIFFSQELELSYLSNKIFKLLFSSIFVLGLDLSF